MVAVQFVNIVPYLFEKRLGTDEHWQPIVLLPAKAANMATPIGLIRYPEWFLNRGLAELATTGKYQARLLIPRYAGATADEFFGIGTGEEVPLPRRYPTASDLASWSSLVSKAGVPSQAGLAGHSSVLAPTLGVSVHEISNASTGTNKWRRSCND